MAIRPVSHRVTQNFGVKNSAYRLGYHPGTDYGSPTATPIKATTDGYVRYYAGNNGGYGNVVALILKNGDVVWHTHLQRPGRTGSVKKGTVIGYTNNTGWSTGPHLHVEYRLGGNQNRPINFETWLKQHPEKKPAPKPVYTTVRKGEGLSHLAKRAGYSSWNKSSSWQHITNLNKKGWTWQRYNSSLKPGAKVRVK